MRVSAIGMSVQEITKIVSVIKDALIQCELYVISCIKMVSQIESLDNYYLKDYKHFAHQSISERKTVVKADNCLWS